MKPPRPNSGVPEKTPEQRADPLHIAPQNWGGGAIKLLITGGGTGGHVTPALATIEAVRARAPGTDWMPKFLYVGSKHGVEQGLAEAAGIPFVGVESGKLRRAVSVRGLLTVKNLADALRVPVGIWQAMGEVRKFRPDAVLATGGYVSVPTVIAAGLLGRPVLIHEQTVQIGLANKIAARFATRIALTFADAAQELPESLRSKTFVTGNPVRPVIFGGDKDRAIERFGFDASENNLPTVYVTGGALGAKSINQAVVDCLPGLLESCRIVHQCGRQDGEKMAAIKSALPVNLARRYWVVPFVGDEIADIFVLCELIVGRSGAGTVTEAAAVGKPALFIPLVPTGGDEQTRNAQRSVDAGAAVILPSRELSGPRLLPEIAGLLADPDQLARMGQAALTLATPNAAFDLADALLALANRRSDA